MTEVAEPTRLWYTVGGLEATLVIPDMVNQSPGIRTLLEYRTRLDKKVAATLGKRIEATWFYLGALAWCLKHTPQILDNIPLPWTNDKGEQVVSNHGMALEYLATLLSLTGLYSIKAKADRDEGLRVNCAVTLEHCAQCCEAAAFHIQRHLTQSLLSGNFSNVTPVELNERSKLLRLCAQQELIDKSSSDGALFLIRELHAFSTSARQIGMRAFSQCMLTDWRITMARRLGADLDHDTLDDNVATIVTEKSNYEQSLRAHHYIMSTARKHEQKFKKDSYLSRFMPEFSKRVDVEKKMAKRNIDKLMGKRAHHLMVTSSTDLGDLDPIVSAKPNMNVLESALFDGIGSDPVKLANIPLLPRVFLDTLKEHIDHFASSDAQPPISNTIPTPVPIMTLDEFAFMKIPLAHRAGVKWGILAERRRVLEEKCVLWPSLENQLDLAEVAALMNKTMLDMK